MQPKLTWENADRDNSQTEIKLEGRAAVEDRYSRLDASKVNGAHGRTVFFGNCGLRLLKQPQYGLAGLRGER